MRTIIYLFLIALISSCESKGQTETSSASTKLSISHNIDLEEESNAIIIDYLAKFLESKNDSYYENEYWYQADFEKFFYPFYDIYKIEKKDTISNFYKPLLMEIIETDSNNVKILKIAFIGFDQSKKESSLKCIYNIIASVKGNRVIFSNPLPYMTRTWKTIKKGSLLYVISPNREFVEEDVNTQISIIDKICKFYNTQPLHITYYSCSSPKEIFNIKGFDYNPMMYVSKYGGLSAHHNIVFSGNNSEIYTHEILHLYNVALFPSIPKLINEGIATYIGGSGQYDYSWHKQNLRKHVEQNTAINLSKHLEPFERFYVGEDTSIPYMIGALICERTFRLYGKEKLLTLLNGESGFWQTLSEVGLTKDNLDVELKKELALPLTTPIK